MGCERAGDGLAMEFWVRHLLTVPRARVDGGAGSAGLSETPNEVVRSTGCPFASNDRFAFQTPNDGNVTSLSSYTPRLWEGEVRLGLVGTCVPGAGT